MRLRITTSLMLAAVLAAPGVARAQGGGSSPDGSSDTGGAAWEAPPTAALTPGGVRGGSVRWSGTVPAGGRPVRVERPPGAAPTRGAGAPATPGGKRALPAPWAPPPAGGRTR